MRGVKTLCPAVLLVIAVVPGCSRDDAPRIATKTAVSSASGPGLVTVAAKPEIVPADKRRVFELEGGVRVEVIAEGAGLVVGTGDEVALSLTLSYSPKSPEEVAMDAAQAEAAARVEADAPKKSESKAAKDGSDSTGPEAEKDSQSAMAAIDASNPADESAKPLPPLLTDSAATSAVGDDLDTTAADPQPESPAVADSTAESEAATVDAQAKSEASALAETDAPNSADATNAASVVSGAPTTDAPDAPAEASASTEGTAPAPTALGTPLEPVIVVSTKNMGTPIRARIGSSGALLPGLSRALVGLRQGTIAEITLPAEAAYGAAGLPSAGIPPGTALLARVEIREVRR